MKIIGIDLSGPRNFKDTCLVSFKESGDLIELIEAREGADDRQIIEAICGLGSSEPIIVGIDAPLSYNENGGDRPSDAELRRLVHAKTRRVGIMPPTMIRMVYLTLRGLALTRIWESLKPQFDLRIVEVHPGACMLLRGAEIEDVTGFKRHLSARQNLLNWFESKGMMRIPRGEAVTDHFVAACGAALGAWQWALGKSVWRSEAKLPHHPYDFAC